MTLTLPAPAKLNLFLHIIGQRDDGYHQLQTLFTFLDYSDSLSFAPATTLQLVDAGPTPADNSNLILRAARLLQQHTGTQQGVRITLNKRLPMGGGLGGGSSNAATTLLALNHLWRTQLSLQQLAALGVTLGADVPVFVKGATAFAEGVGEKLTPVALPERHYVVINPGESVSTAEIFASPQLTRDKPPIKVADFLAQPAEFLAANGTENVFKPIVRQHFPAIDRALQWLAKEAGNSYLTGTGACVFAATANRQQAVDILSRLPVGWQGFSANSCCTSPLHQQLAALN